MEEGSKKRKREDDPPRITVCTPRRTFERLFKETSLSSLRSTIAKKLSVDEKAIVELVQNRNGRIIDLEDEDDFDAFRSFAHSNGSAEVKVKVDEQARSVSFALESENIEPGIVRPKKKKRKEADHNVPSPVENADSTTSFPEPTAILHADTNDVRVGKEINSSTEKKDVPSTASNEVGPSQIATERPRSSKKKQKLRDPNPTTVTSLATKEKKGKTTVIEATGTSEETSQARAPSALVREEAESLTLSKDVPAPSSSVLTNSERLTKRKKKKKGELVEQPGTENSNDAQLSVSTPGNVDGHDDSEVQTLKANEKTTTPPSTSASIVPSEEFETVAVGKNSTKRTTTKEAIPKAKRKSLINAEPGSSAQVDLETSKSSPAEVEKKIPEEITGGPSTDHGAVIENTSGPMSKKKRRTTDGAQVDTPAITVPSPPPSPKKSKRVSLAAGAPTDDALDDIISNILKHHTSPSILSQLKRVDPPTPSTSNGTAPNKEGQKKKRASMTAENHNKGNALGVTPKAKAGKGRKKAITDSDEYPASSSLGKADASTLESDGMGNTTGKMGMQTGKRVTRSTTAPSIRPGNVTNPALTVASIESEEQTLPANGRSKSLSKGVKEDSEGRKGRQSFTYPKDDEPNGNPLPMHAFAPSGSNISEVIVQGKDEGSSVDSESDSDDANSSEDEESSNTSPLPLEIPIHPENPIGESAAISDATLAESLLRPNQPLNWRSLLSQGENDDSENEKASDVQDEDEDELRDQKRERRKRRSAAAGLRKWPSSSPSVEDEDEENENINDFTKAPGKFVAETMVTGERVTGGALCDNANDQESSTHSNADSGYGSVGLKHLNGIEAGPLICGSQLSAIDSELNLPFKDINDRGESVVSEGIGGHAFSQAMAEDDSAFLSCLGRRSEEKPADYDLPDVHQAAARARERGLSSVKSRTSLMDFCERQGASKAVITGTNLSLLDTAASSRLDGEPLSVARSDGQRERGIERNNDGPANIHRKASAEPNISDVMDRALSETNVSLSSNRRSFTPPPIETLPPGTPGTIKRMKNRFRKIHDLIDTSKSSLVVVAGSQGNSSNSAEPGLDDTTSPEDHFDQLKSSSLPPPQVRQSTKAAAINTVKRARKAPEKKIELDGAEQPIGARLRKRRETTSKETTLPKALPLNSRRPLRTRLDKEPQGIVPTPATPLGAGQPPKEVIPEVKVGEIISVVPDMNLSLALAGPSHSSQGILRSSISEVEDALDDKGVENDEMEGREDNEGESSAGSSETESDEGGGKGKGAQIIQRDHASKLSINNYRSLVDIASQRNALFVPTNSQPSFLLTPVKSFDNSAALNSQIRDEDEDSEETSSDSDSDEGLSVIPRERRAGSRTTKSRGGFASILSMIPS